jgi:hypothetical protein
MNWKNIYAVKLICTVNFVLHVGKMGGSLRFGAQAQLNHYPHIITPTSLMQLVLLYNTHRIVLGLIRKTDLYEVLFKKWHFPIMIEQLRNYYEYFKIQVGTSNPF